MKYMVFCADGTWNGQDVDDDDDDVPDATNVLKAFHLLQGDTTLDSRRLKDESEKILGDPDQPQLVAKYLHGVGDSDNRILKVLGGAFGAGMIGRIVRGYTFISRHHQAGDRIVIRGFSRGAYTARALAGMISSVGLLDSNAMNEASADGDGATKLPMIPFACRMSRHAAPAGWHGRKFWLALFLLCASPMVHSFESNEHLRMSNAALAIGIGYVESLPSSDARSKALQAAATLLLPPKLGPSAQRAPDAKPLLERGQYGKLTECVDFFLQPEKMLAFAWRPSGRLAGIVVSETVLPDGAATVIPPELLEQCQKVGIGSIQASHGNHAHFQQDLIVSIRLYHALARTVARDEGNPYAALVLNAISDHYLQDFFAPGHLVTPRDRLTDLPATAMHDLANQMGAIFRPDATLLGPILDYLCGAKVSVQVLPACTPPDRVRAVLDGIGIPVDKLGAFLLDIMRGKPMLFRGDGQLDKPPQDAQRLLLLAVQTRSIVDILDGENHFLNFSFSYQLSEGKPTATAPFGHYDFEVQGAIAPVLAANADPAVVQAAQAGGSKTQTSVFSICSFGSCQGQLYPLLHRSPVLSASFQRESESSGMHEARNVWAFEFSPIGSYRDLSKLSGGYLTGVEMAAAFGYQYYQHGRRSGHGPSLRLPFYVPETEFSVGPYARWLNYRDLNGDSRKLSYGLRMDAGFSTYATFFIGFGLDYSNDALGNLQKTSLWTAGLRLGFPLTRIAFWNR